MNKKIYLLVILFLGLVLMTSFIFLKKPTRTSNSSFAPKITPTNMEKQIPQGGLIKIKFEGDQKINTNQDLKAKIIFESPSESIGGVDVILTFDPTKISISEIKPNNQLFENFFVNRQKESEGKIKITTYQPKKTLIGEYLLADLSFMLLKKEEALLKIDFSQSFDSTDSNLISQENKKDILVKVEDLKISPF